MKNTKNASTHSREKELMNQTFILRFKTHQQILCLQYHQMVPLFHLEWESSHKNLDFCVISKVPGSNRKKYIFLAYSDAH